DGIDAARQLETQNRHTEGLAMIGGMFATEAHEVFLRDTKLIAQGAEMLFDEIGAEAIVAGGNGSMRGEDNFARDLAGRGIEVESFFFHAGTNRLKNCETAVALVEMQDAWRDAHCFESTEAADTQEKFLTDTCAGVAAVKT